MSADQASDGAIGGKEAIRHVATGLIRQSTTAMGAAVDLLIARLKTDAKFRQMIYTQPFSMGADVSPELLEFYEQAIHGLCLSANDGERQQIIEKLSEMKPTEEESTKGFQGGIDAAIALVTSRMPIAPQPTTEGQPEPPPKVILE